MTQIRRFNNQGWLPSVFNDLFDNDWMVRANTTVTPSINVVEDEKGYTVEMAVPGMTKEDFMIHLNENNELVISMEKKTENEDKGNRKYLRREFFYSKFKQALVLPENVDKDKIAATVNDGVLTIELPRLAPEEKVNVSRKIEVK
ncbi:MAG: Hsp20/alpha crystallin family protein [Paraprevotella sp.]|nr:Hsp20/alpha crystallin family protein [Paraprevotella sp.]MBP3472094.1 Hsp20/alpha crystallin family protein [Paraprevotella sp.]